MWWEVREGYLGPPTAEGVEDDDFRDRSSSVFLLFIPEKENKNFLHLGRQLGSLLLGSVTRPTQCYLKHHFAQ